MNKLNFTTCLNTVGIETGINSPIIGLYDFSAYDTIKIVYNQNYDQLSSNYYSGSIILADALPLINRQTNQLISSGFNSKSCYSFGDTVTGDFSVLLNLSYDGCARTTTGVDYILLSSIPNPSGINSGFYVGINDSNRLFIKTSGVTRTINQELKKRNFAFLSISNQKYIQLGVYDFPNADFVYDSFELETELPKKTPLYLGSFLNNINPSFTGFSGVIPNTILFKQAIELEELSNCINCLFVTGFRPIETGVINVSIPIITGYEVKEVYESGITGHTYVSGSVPNSSGGNITVYTQVGLTGFNLVNSIVNVQTGFETVSITGEIAFEYLYDEGLLAPFNVYSLEFENGFASGDIVEIYTYNYYNSKVNNELSGLAWPDGLGVQLIGNGLLETSGIDFKVISGMVSGFETDDILSYDIVTGTKIIVPYSGLWSRSRIALSGGGYYPSTSQYQEISSGNILITGVSGFFLTSHDIYLNGQKLISGINYNSSGTSIILYGSGLPDFFAEPLTGHNGLVTGVTDIQDSEMIFLPKEGNPNRYLFQINSNNSGSLINGVTGFSEQIWINGIRQTIDYQKNFECSLQSGISNLTDYSFNFYNNDSRYFNII